MTLASLDAIERLLDDGAIVVGERPDGSPSLRSVIVPPPIASSSPSRARVVEGGGEMGAREGDACSNGRRASAGARAATVGAGAAATTADGGPATSEERVERCQRAIDVPPSTIATIAAAARQPTAQPFRAGAR